jgi:hypothetical protein
MRLPLSLGAIALGLAISATPASAAVIYSGFTDGCFACTPVSTPNLTTVSDSNHLQFTNTTFSNVNAGTSFGLGSFHLGNGTSTYDEIFNLLVTFTVPAGSGANTFVADVDGHVQGNGADTPLTVTFDNPQLAFNGFTLTVSNLTGITTGDRSFQLTGTIAAAPVPGPTVGAGASSFAIAALFLGWLVRRRTSQLV